MTTLRRRFAMRLLVVTAAASGTLILPSGHAHAVPNASPSRDAHDSDRVLPRSIHQTPHGRYVRDLCEPRQRMHCLARELLPETWRPGSPLPDAGAAAPTGLSASILAAAYEIPTSAQGGGRIVAVIDAPDDHALADVAAYRKMQGLSPMDRCNGLPTGSGTPCFAQVAEDGGPSTNTDPLPVADGETSLDLDMVSLGCADCSLLLVEINPNFCETDLLQGVATAAKLGASAISISLGGPEATDPNAISVGAGGAENGTTACPAEADWQYDAPGPFSTPGHLVVASSGDYAYDAEEYRFSPTVGGAAPCYPASSPYVLAVGGTALYWSASSTGEGVWDQTTSGCSSEFAMPPWQAPLLSGTSCRGRATADVSAMATFFVDGAEVGIDAVVDGKSVAFEGSSASAPLVAGILTRLDLTTEISNDLSFLYEHKASLNDIGSPEYPIPSAASSTNAPDASSCGVLCTTRPGWDGPSGAGSLNGARLAALAVSAAGPQPYPDAGVCGPPYGPCGSHPAAPNAGQNESGEARAAGCACETSVRGRPSGGAWGVLGVLVGARRRSRQSRFRS